MFRMLLCYKNHLSSSLLDYDKAFQIFKLKRARMQAQKYILLIR